MKGNTPVKQRHIVAVGGGSFNARPDDPVIERYMLALTRKKRPKVLFIPTASAEPADYISTFFDAFTKIGATPSVLRLFRRTPDLRDTLLNQDMIYVGGGNTKSMLAVWRDWGLDVVLREAWRAGIVLGGVSAGAICWFDMGVTDSWSDRLAPLPGLGFLPNTCCPHYDSEADRRPSVHAFVQNSQVPRVLALHDGAAGHFIGRTLHRSLVWSPEAKAFSVTLKRGQVLETELPSIRLV